GSDVCSSDLSSDGPYDEGLPAPHVTCREYLVEARLVGRRIGGDIAPRIKRDAEFLQHAFMHGMNEAHGEEDEVRPQLKFRAGHGLHLLIHTHTFDGGDVTILADDAARHHCEVTRGTFRLAGGCPHLERPVRPGEKLVLTLWRGGHDFKLCDGKGTLTERGADAVRSRVAAANDDDMLAAC